MTVLEAPAVAARSRSAVHSASVRYVGRDEPPGSARVHVQAASVARLAVSAGDEVTLRHDDGGCTLWLLCFNEQRQPAPLLQGLNATKVPVDRQRFDAQTLDAWLGQTAVLLAHELGGSDTAPGSAQRFTASSSGSLWCIAPTASANATDPSGGAASMHVTRKAGTAPREDLPEPFGPLRDELRVEAGTARAYRVRAGECIQIIDVQGQQCSDFMAVREDALAQGRERSIDGTVTRTMVGGAYPGPGLYDKYFDQEMRPLLVVVQDTVGRHDTFGLACTARGYEERGFFDHANCSDNISAAYQPFGIAARAAWPAINLFFNSWILPGDNRLRSDEGWSRPGDYVVMRALTDLICVSTACPADTDGINGWNPTDIHVRIYPPGQHIPTAVAYRADAQAKATMSQPSAFHLRTSALTRQFAAVRDLWLPTSFEGSQALEEAQACRETVTLQDMSALRKFDIAGPDAQTLLDLCSTRDVRRLSVGRGHYTLVCDEAGAVIDDGTLFRLTPDVFRWFPSSERSAMHMKEVAAERGLAVWVRAHDASLPNLSLQGPKSRELLADLVFIQPTHTALAQLKWFGCTVARLRDREGPAFMLTRSGYTGELGFEIFCGRNDALQIWDAIMQAGERHGIKPMGSEALGILRIEAGLAAHGAEFGNEIDAFEAGLSFAIDFNKEQFIGKPALERIKAAPRRLLTGLVLAGNEVPTHGDGVFQGRQRVGTVTSAVRSPALGKAIALARVAVEWAEPGHALEVGRLDGQMKRLACTTAPFPFVDPQRVRARA